MWALIQAHPFGSQPKRNLFMFIVATFIAIFTYTIAFAPVTHAADAEWGTGANPSITYNGHEFTKATRSFGGEGSKLPTDKSFTYTIPQLVSSTDPKQVAVIYFKATDNLTTAKSASYALYTVTPPNIYQLTSTPTAITIAAQPNRATSAGGTSSCSNPELNGIGWMVCPISTFLASSMDNLYKILSDFLTVQPLQITQNNSMYRSWAIMRNFANIAFVIAFMIIIYSQITNLGISNYGIKRLLPRIIIAAILVNVSYWICAISIDISNIAGWSIQDIFQGIRDSVVSSSDPKHVVNTDWKEITTLILSGGAATGIGALALLTGTGGAAIAAISLLLPLLVTLILAILVAIIIMAARQAIIVILVIISPLIFVAYLLPNTEKYYEKGRDTFGTMLFLFPIFSVIFGGSQLAGDVIIQNATSIVMILIGMGVKVAPVVITPLLIKFGGSLVARVAGIANNPNRGLIDRTRKFANEQADYHKAKALAQGSRSVFGRNLGGTKNLARRLDNRRRKREGWTSKYGLDADNNWHDSDAYRQLHEAEYRAETKKQLIEANNDTHLKEMIRSTSGLLEQELRLKVALDRQSIEKARMETLKEEFATGRYTGPPSTSTTLANLMNGAEEATRELALVGMRKQAAERAGKSRLTQDLLKNTATIDGQTLREFGGGIQGAEGASSILAASVAEYRKEYGARISEKTELMRHFELSSQLRQDLAMGQDVTGTKNGVSYVFRKDDDYAREAAIEDQLKTGSEGNILQIIKESGAGGRTADYHTTISAAIPANGIQNKILFTGGKVIDDIYKGTLIGDRGLTEAALYHVTEGKIKDETLSIQGPESLRILFDTITHRGSVDPTKQAEFDANYQQLRYKAWTILNTPLLNKNVSDSSRKILKAQAVKPPKP
jgi:hypothetical protein